MDHTLFYHHLWELKHWNTFTRGIKVSWDAIWGWGCQCGGQWSEQLGGTVPRMLQECIAQTRTSTLLTRSRISMTNGKGLLCLLSTTSRSILTQVRASISVPFLINMESQRHFDVTMTPGTPHMWWMSLRCHTDFNWWPAVHISTKVMGTLREWWRL